MITGIKNEMTALHVCPFIYYKTLTTFLRENSVVTEYSHFIICLGQEILMSTTAGEYHFAVKTDNLITVCMETLL
jgi:hypothetical protein